jgi:hypothetical protein
MQGMAELDSQHDPWQAAIDYGIDVNQLDYVLTLTPLERVERHDRGDSRAVSRSGRL